MLLTDQVQGEKNGRFVFSHFLYSMRGREETALLRYVSSILSAGAGVAESADS